MFANDCQITNLKKTPMLCILSTFMLPWYWCSNEFLNENMIVFKILVWIASGWMQCQGLRILNMKQTLENQTKHITTLSQNIHLALEIIRSLLKYVDWEGIKTVFFFLGFTIDLPHT
jgi:hypothetical protein